MRREHHSGESITEEKRSTHPTASASTSSISLLPVCLSVCVCLPLSPLPLPLFCARFVILSLPLSLSLTPPPSSLSLSRHAPHSLLTSFHSAFLPGVDSGQPLLAELYERIPWRALARAVASTHPRTPPQTRPCSIKKRSSCAALKMPPDMHAYLGWGSALEAAADDRGLERQRGIALKRLRPFTAC